MASQEKYIDFAKDRWVIVFNIECSEAYCLCSSNC